MSTTCLKNRDSVQETKQKLHLKVYFINKLKPLKKGYTVF